MRLSGKTALITGGNSGIGLATARLFVAEGAKVAITGRDQARLDAAVEELGVGAFAAKADVTHAEATAKAVAAAVERFGKLDIVFANAGIPGTTPVGETPLAAFEQILRTNLTGAFSTVQAALPHLNDAASIVLVGSVHAVLGMPGYSAYAASKGGIRAMARVLAAELSPRRIRVNVVTPGAVRTPIWDASTPTPEARAALEARIARVTPLARFGDADDVAKVVLFLASDESGHVQGAEIVVDGGHTQAPGGSAAYQG